MDDLISRSTLFNIVEPRLDYLRDKYGPYDHYTDGYEECYDRLAEAPAVDAVEVVRCKECKHRINDKDFVRGHYCKKRPSNGGYFCEDNDFCSYGERSGVNDRRPL